MKLIDKDALVAEIEKRINFNRTLNAHSRADECNAILSFINSLEVKEVDLEKEANECWNYVFSELGWDKNSIMTMKHDEFMAFAKHFFEIGLNASNPLTWEDMRELHIIFSSLDVDIELSHSELQKETIGYYEEVLKQFKAQKGE